jgi:hypothetical protein
MPVNQGLDGNEYLAVFACNGDQILHWDGTGLEVIAEMEWANGKGLSEMR